MTGVVGSDIQLVGQYRSIDCLLFVVPSLKKRASPEAVNDSFIGEWSDEEEESDEEEVDEEVVGILL